MIKIMTTILAVMFAIPIMAFLAMIGLVILGSIFPAAPKSSAQASSVSSSPFYGEAIPACTPKTYDEALRSYSAKLTQTEKQQLVLAVGSLDGWYNIQAGKGHSFSEQDTIKFLATNVCGRTGARIEQLSRSMLGLE